MCNLSIFSVVLLIHNSDSNTLQVIHKGQKLPKLSITQLKSLYTIDYICFLNVASYSKICSFSQTTNYLNSYLLSGIWSLKRNSGPDLRKPALLMQD